MNREELILSCQNCVKNLVKKYNITREEQDAYSFRSQQRMAAAMEQDFYKEQIVPITEVKSAIINEFPR